MGDIWKRYGWNTEGHEWNIMESGQNMNRVWIDY